MKCFFKEFIHPSDIFSKYGNIIHLYPNLVRGEQDLPLAGLKSTHSSASWYKAYGLYGVKISVLHVLWYE